jgi:hypothetical protein
MPNCHPVGYIEQPTLRCCYNCKYCIQVEYEASWVCVHAIHDDELVEPTGMCAYIVQEDSI